MNKAELLIEALPYIKRFSGKTFVIKLGGSVMEDKKSQECFLEDVALLKLVGINVVLVHGGGKSISRILEIMNIPVEFKQGLRVTDKETVEVVEMVLSGKINKELTGELCKHGISAVGISGRDSHLLQAEKTYAKDGDVKIDVGYVGKITKVNVKFLEDMIKADHVPIISPVAADEEGNVYNVNADYAASAVSSALHAEKLILLSDVKGLLSDIQDENSVVTSITAADAKSYIADGTIRGGMIPKIKYCCKAIEYGTKDVHIIDGRVKHSLLVEVFTKAGIGTMVRG